MFQKRFILNILVFSTFTMSFCNVDKFFDRIKRGDVIGARQDLEKGMSPDATTGESGYTPLIVAAGYNQLEIAKILIQFGADVNKKADGKTPLMVAICFGNNGIVKLLINKGGDVNQESYLLFPIMHAILSQNEEAISMLLNTKKVDLNKKNSAGAFNSVLCRAMFHSRSAECSSKKYALLKRLLELGADPNMPDEVYGLPLVLASAELNNKQITRILLDGGADPQTKGVSLFQFPWFYLLKRFSIRISLNK